MSEQWLALNRMWTVGTLKRRLRTEHGETPYTPDPTSMLYVAASALPYHTSGYTTRTHEVIRALRSAGADVHAVTRPGYPWDRRDRLQQASGTETLVGDVRYQHIERPANSIPALSYALRAAPILADIAVRQRVAVIHAASNHVNALPALLAARSLGIPFQYEMRGLWELTRVSRTPRYEGSQAYRQGLQLEGLVASQADRLFVISEQLAKFASNRWRVTADRMALLPNCVDPDRFTITDARSVMPDSLGYAGSLIGYEGLDTLIDAVDLLAKMGRRVVVNVIGDGEARPQLEAQVRRLDLADRIHFHGKLPPQFAREMLGRSEVVCIPRKPFLVCQIVPPIKLAEALAMGKPVIAADLPVLRDEMGECCAGRFFRAGDPRDLARVIGEMFGDRTGLRAMGEQARRYVVAHRNWGSFVKHATPMAQYWGLE
ncbi:glycosyltransferase family 4 protein [Achromobacter insuavis]